MLHTIKNDYLQVTVSELGAELQSIQDCNGTEYLWQGDPKYWKGKAINIFPYVGRMVNSEYFLDGNRYQLDIHGFARFCRFCPVEADALHLTLELTDSEDLLAQFPRKFSFRVIYTLKDNALEITYQVENRDEKNMRFGLGGHPGFNIPFGGGEFEDYRIRFADKCHPKQVLFSDTVLVAGEADYPLQDEQYIPLRHNLFDQDVVLLKNVVPQVTLESPKTQRSVTIRFPDMPYVGFWHRPETDAPYVCVEPWCSLPAAHGKPTVLEEQADLLVLEPGKIYTNTWTVSID